MEKIKLGIAAVLPPLNRTSELLQNALANRKGGVLKIFDCEVGLAHPHQNGRFALPNSLHWIPRNNPVTSYYDKAIFECLSNK